MAKKNQNNSDDLRQESDEDLDDVVDSVIGVDEKEKNSQQNPQDELPIEELLANSCKNGCRDMYGHSPGRERAYCLRPDHWRNRASTSRSDDKKIRTRFAHRYAQGKTSRRGATNTGG